jgi:hypothetical protein
MNPQKKEEKKNYIQYEYRQEEYTKAMEVPSWIFPSLEAHSR